MFKIGHICCYLNVIMLFSKLSASKVYLHKPKLDILEKVNLQHPDLPQRDLFDDGIVFGLHELFDGDDLARISVPALEHNTVGALANLPNLLVLLHLQASLRWTDRHVEGQNRSI